MSVRQDNENNNKNCPSRGLGIAAAAIGVGVGAALYYLFSKREDPDASGATSSWRCEREHALSSDTSFTTISEHSTTDTSINSTIDSSNESNNMSFNETSLNNTSYNETSDNATSDNETSDNETSDNEASDYETSYNETSAAETSDNETSYNETSFNRSSGNVRTITTDFASIYDESITDVSYLIPNETQSNEEPSLSYIESILQSDASFETGYMTLHLNSSINRENTSLTQDNSVDSETNTEWDVTNSSLDVPYDLRWNESRGVRRILNTVLNLTSPTVRRRRTEEEQMAILREQAFRERSWSPEECSICFDMMTQTQEVMALPCTHRFHQACILPWLQERQTCPNCRKTA